MNRRKLSQLNNLLRTSLGTAPQYAWCHTDSSELQHPVQVYRQALNAEGKLGMEPVYDYLCSCGKNVAIHALGCKMSRAIPRCRVEPRLPDFPGKWVFCRLQEVPKYEWMRVMGHDEHYRPLMWTPQEIQRLPAPGFMILKDDPNLEVTRLMISVIKEFREYKASEWREQLEARLLAKEAAVATKAENAAEDEYIRQEKRPAGLIHILPGVKHEHTARIAN